eukprot:scaffold12089_cov40-Prasinocladus_malaysianus.AAC.2
MRIDFYPIPACQSVSAAIDRERSGENAVHMRVIHAEDDDDGIDEHEEGGSARDDPSALNISVNQRYSSFPRWLVARIARTAHSRSSTSRVSAATFNGLYLSSIFGKFDFVRM